MIIKVNAYFCSIEMDSVTYQVTETFSNIDISIGNFFIRFRLLFFALPALYMK